jgi:transcription initiation factor TFIIIB Brf1 subunit/transcription initiation factor TFIIB
MVKKDKCWLCLRIDAKKVLEISRSLFGELKLAHKIGERAIELIQQAYFKNRTAFSGRKSAGIIGASILLASKEYSKEIERIGITMPTKVELCEICGIVLPTLNAHEKLLVNVIQRDK